MCAVRAQSETKCRQSLVVALLLLLGLCNNCMPLVLPTPWPDASLDSCHDEYLLAGANASNNFARDYELCELTANETKIDLSIDVELERLQIELGRATLCENFQLCDSLEVDLEYFECVTNNGNRNLDLITEINRNATSAHTRLREDLNEVQQTFVLCTLDAQVEYVDRMRQAYEELQQCRSELAN